MGKEYIKAVYHHPVYLTEMPGFMTHRLEERLPGEISITSDIRLYHSNDRKWSGTQCFLMKVKKESKKLAFHSQKTKHTKN